MTAEIKLTSNIRISSIDLLRGIVMMIMALDHTRDFFHNTAMTADPLNPATTTGMLFFTRWITHFCAPIFVFLSGLSAYLSSAKKTEAEATSFWIKRGIWLIVAEVTIITFGLTFNPLFSFIILQVIWVIGISFILLALVRKLSEKLILIIGLLLIFGHDVFNHITAPASEPASLLLKTFFTAFGNVVPIGGNHFIGIFYAILPWTGIMFIGYAAGKWFSGTYDAARRQRNLLISGTLMLCLFILLRLTNVYGDQFPRKEFGDLFKNFLSFMNVSKYPPSLSYTCLTVGSGLLLLGLFENLKGKWVQIVSVYGSVPFFYYILHFYLLHLILVVVFFISGFGVDEIIPNNPFLFRPATLGFSLPIVYLLWMAVVAVLYKPCKWFKRYKSTHQQWWLKYV